MTLTCVVKERIDGPPCGDEAPILVVVSYDFGGDETRRFELPTCGAHRQALLERVDGEAYAAVRSIEAI